MYISVSVSYLVSRVLDNSSILSLFNTSSIVIVMSSLVFSSFLIVYFSSLISSFKDFRVILSLLDTVIVVPPVKSTPRLAPLVWANILPNTINIIQQEQILNFAYLNEYGTPSDQLYLSGPSIYQQQEEYY